MPKVTLGMTGITVEKNAFGALPIQRVSMEDAARLLQKAYHNGVHFFDTARGYSDSEEKIGNAFVGLRENLYIATKTPSATVEGFWSDLEKSLQMLKTDYIDLYQFHDPDWCPRPGDGTGMYEAMLEAKAQGKIRHIGITNHRLPIATEAVESGLYETLQFPFSYLAGDKDIALVNLCKEKNVGFIAMKALSGGLISNSAAAYAYLVQFDNVLPIWGIQKENELDEFLSYTGCPPTLDGELQKVIDADREQLVGDFCRGCGYCLPCPAEIDIPMSARISLLLRRAPSANFQTPEWQEKMSRIDNCIGCMHCEQHCPYELHTVDLLRRNYELYKAFPKI